MRVIDEQQSEWKRHRWQKMNTKFLKEETNKQLDIVRGLPEDIFTWDVYMGLHESISTIQVGIWLRRLKIVDEEREGFNISGILIFVGNGGEQA